MTAPETTVDPVRAFREALPRRVRDQLHNTLAVVGLVNGAVNMGWPTDRLAAECARDLHDVANAGAVVMHRLQQASEHPPVLTGRSGLPVTPLCGQCEDGWILDPETLRPVDRCSCRKRATA